VAIAGSQDAAYPDIAYDLATHDGAVMTVFRSPDNGVQLAADRIAWTVGTRNREMPLSAIVLIRLSTEVETVEGPIGATLCQISFADGSAVTVFGGNSRSRDAIERLARYQAFVNDLHRRLGPNERASIRFVAGFGGARFGFLLVAALLSVVLFLLTPLALLPLAGSAEPRLLVALLFGVILNFGLFRLLQRNAPHMYDPHDPLGSAAGGSIGQTLREAVVQFRAGLTPGGRFAWSALGTAVIAGIVVAIASHRTVGLFAPGEARLAFGAVLEQAGRGLKVSKVEITPQALTIEAPDPGGSSRRSIWIASRRTLFGWTEWDHVSGPEDKYDTSVAEDSGQQPFTLQADDGDNLDALAAAAIERAALGNGSAVTGMRLVELTAFVRAEPPRWQVDVVGPRGRAQVFANRDGQLFPAPNAPVGAPRVVIRAAFNTWMRVLNSDQTVLFDRVLEAGESYAVPNSPGVRLQTGNAASLEPEKLIAGTAAQD